MADLGRAQRRVDADEEHLQVGAERSVRAARPVGCPACASSPSRSRSRRRCSTTCAAAAGHALAERGARRAVGAGHGPRVPARARRVLGRRLRLARAPSAELNALAAVRRRRGRRARALRPRPPRRHPADPDPRLAERVHRAAAAGRAPAGLRPRDPVAAGLRVLDAPAARAPPATSPRSGTADAGPRLRALRRGRRRLGRRGDDLHGARGARAAARHPPLQPRQRAAAGDAADRRRARLRWPPPSTGTRPSAATASSRAPSRRRSPTASPTRPSALAAWILEKWRSWADTGGDLARFDRDFLLTLVTLYWVTNTISTANRDYFDNRAAGTARSLRARSYRPDRDRQLPLQPRQRGRAPARVGGADLRRRALHRTCAAAATSPPPRSRTCSPPTSRRSSRLSPGRRRSASGRRPCAARSGSRPGESRTRALSPAAVTASTDQRLGLGISSSLVSAL